MNRAKHGYALLDRDGLGEIFSGDKSLFDCVPGRPVVPAVLLPLKDYERLVELASQQQECELAIRAMAERIGDSVAALYPPDAEEVA